MLAFDANIIPKIRPINASKPNKANIHGLQHPPFLGAAGRGGA